MISEHKTRITSLKRNRKNPSQEAICAFKQFKLFQLLHAFQYNEKLKTTSKHQLQNKQLIMWSFQQCNMKTVNWHIKYDILHNSWRMRVQFQAPSAMIWVLTTHLIHDIFTKSKCTNQRSWSVCVEYSNILCFAK